MEDTTEQAPKGPLTAIGTFLSVFGVAVIAGIFFTESTHGKVINLFCGGLLVGIGAIAIYNDQFRKKNQ